MNYTNDDKTCTVENCASEALARGYCIKHYMRFKKYGDTSYVQDRVKNIGCDVDGCDGEHSAKGYCTKHYQRYRKYGDANYFIVDKSPPETCTFKGCKNKYFASGYCNKHYTRYLRYGDASILKASANTLAIICKKDNCGLPHFGRGYCKYHYYRSDFQREKAQKRRVNKYNSPFNDFHESMVSELKKYFNDSCAYCGVKVGDYHLEHVTPLSRGGSHSKNNIIISCPSCNYKKSRRTLEEWYPLQSFYDRERERKILEWLGYEINENKIQLRLF